MIDLFRTLSSDYGEIIDCATGKLESISQQDLFNDR